MNISEISIGTISTFGSNASLINYLKKHFGKGKIRFPDGIPSIPIRYTQQPRFIIVKENFDGASLSRFKTAKSKIPVTNATETENRFLLEKERIEIQKGLTFICLIWKID